MDNKLGRTARMTPWYEIPLPVGMKLRRRVRPLLFYLSRPVWNYLLKRGADTRVDGLRLRTVSNVFHPNFFFSGRILGRYLSRKDVPGKKVLDMGTGSGIVGIMAARRGALVVAVDINPAAVALARENARLQNLELRMRTVESDLFARLDPAEQFDWIAFNPPYFRGPAPSTEAAAWFAGENYETIYCFLDTAKNFLRENGRIVLIVTSDMPLALIDEKTQRCDYEIIAHQSEPHLFEIFHLLELQARTGPRIIHENS